MRLDDRLLDVLRQVAPGTALRPGLERILRANTGALIVLGSPPQVEALFTGGFQIDVPFTAQRLSELAKMDGALVLDETGGRILWANVHLMPDPAIGTVETGTRHRTAERVARQAEVPVISVSHSMHTITLYVDDWRHVLDDVGSVLSRANQAVATLAHYRARFDEASAGLDAAELRGQATLRDVLTLLGRAELVRRVAGELEQFVAELGSEGRLLRLQQEELSAGVADEERLTVRDHLRPRPGWGVPDALAELARLTPEELSDTATVAKAIDLTGDATGDPESLDALQVPRGYRLLARVPQLVPQLPPSVVDQVVERFGSLKVILAVGPEDLEEVEGVGPGRARLLREGLKRLADGARPERGG
jgi:diadenylate cyclase